MDSNIVSLNQARQKKEVLKQRGSQSIETRLSDLERDMLTAVELSMSLEKEVEYLEKTIQKLLRLLQAEKK